MQAPVVKEEAEQPRDYIVIKHDTLWDISAKLLKDPFKWPDIWKKNPQIKDPNLIHPGNILRIWPNGKVELIGKQQAPVDMLGAKQTQAVIETVEKTKPEDMPVLSLEPQDEKVVVLEPATENGKAAESAAEPAASLDEQVAALTAPSIESFSASALEHQGFISEKAIIESGAIAASRDGQYLMQSGDVVFISLKNSTLLRESFVVGDKYTIFQVGRKMVHPVTREKLGSLIDILGSLEITATNGTARTITGKILRSFKEIPQGARIRPYTETVKKIEITKTDAKIEGVIVGSHDANDYISVGDIIYIDKGEKSGIKQGNLLDIYKKPTRAMDPYKGEKFNLPLQKAGSLIVASVDKETSACVVISDSMGINPGDSVSSKLAAE